MNAGEEVTILEVGPRDGFQNVSVEIPTEDKIRIVDELVAAGIKSIEVSSFVHPKWIPQLKDAEDVFARIRRLPGVSYSALIPNEQGLDRAMASRVTEVEYVVSASESTSRMVFNKSTAEALSQIPPLAEKAKRLGIRFRGTIACAFGCSVEGQVPADRVIAIGEQLRDAGAFMITLADSPGITHPRYVKELVSAFLERIHAVPVSVHFHNTRGIGLANVYAALESGIGIFESSIAGLGGDPLTPGAPGNVATEAVAYLFDKMGIKTGVDLERLFACARDVEETLRRLSAGEAGDSQSALTTTAEGQ